MTRTFLAAWLLVLALAAPTVAASGFDARYLQVRWEIVENNYQGKTQFLSAFTFTNTGKTDFPREGWTLYFNFIRTPVAGTTTGGVNVERLNGDLFRLTPQADFAGLPAGKSVRIEFIAQDWVINYTDAPAGLYLVWQDAPAVGVPVTNYTVLPSTEPRQYNRFEADKIGLITPQVLYEQNKLYHDIPAQQQVPIFPTPVSYRGGPGTFILTPQVPIQADAAFKREANYLAGELATLLGKRPLVSAASGGVARIVLQQKAMPEEAYTLDVKSEGIIISAGSAKGIFYGIQSLKTLIPPTAWAEPANVIRIPETTVQDAPRFGYRAFFIDVCRNFQEKKEILKLLDLMALYKLNVLHFHLTEDEGWRLEIPGLPELTEIGARRGHTVTGEDYLQPSFGSGPDVNGRIGSGHYTRADYIEILKYATERHIEVIPELETPGHARAAVVAMNVRYKRLQKEGRREEAARYLLSDPEDASEYHSVQGWTDNVINVAMPSTYTFLEKVTDELVAMYKEAGAPLKTVHYGGDEVPAGVWEKSPAVKKLMAAEPAIKTTNDLWYYFYGKVSRMAASKGLYMYGWEEIAMRKTQLDGNPHAIPNPDFVQQGFQVDVWNNSIGWGSEDLAYRLANAGYKVVLSCVSNMYFDMSVYKAFDEPGYYWGAFVDVDKLFYFIPYDYFKNTKEDRLGNPLDRSIFIGKERLTDYGKSNIVGIQGLIWSETVRGPEQLEYKILPKMLGLAERAWAADPAWATEKDPARSEALYADAWSSFATTVGSRELPRLDYYAGGFQYRIPSPGATVVDGKVVLNQQLPGFTLRYTTDGTEPTVKSPAYTAPIAVKGDIKIKAFNTRGRAGKTSTVKNP
jgi:hexosaminidase